MAQLDDTEFFRFAALTAIISLIGKNGNDVEALIEKLAPPSVLEDQNVDDLDDLPGMTGHRAAPATAGEGTVSDIQNLWTHYRQIVDETIGKIGPEHKASDTAAGLNAEVLIWSIQRNRVAHREVVAKQQANRSATAPLLPLQVRLSHQTVKADAAIRLFSIATSDLAWAVIDTGIDANHAAFAKASQSPKEAPSSRVIATLDFTALRDLLAEEFDIVDLVKNFPWNLGKDPGDEEARTAHVLATIDSIRRRNVNGRELDWSLLEH